MLRRRGLYLGFSNSKSISSPLHSFATPKVRQLGHELNYN